MRPLGDWIVFLSDNRWSYGGVPILYSKDMTIALMNAALDAEEPDLVVITDDQIGGDMNAENLQEYIRQFTAPMEEREIPWIITYGNHDEDATTALDEGWNKIRQLEYYTSFTYNANRPSMSGVENFEPNGVNTYAVGDMYQIVYDNTGEESLYVVWALDSNRYNVSDNGMGGYDRIRFEQIQWYYNTSIQLENDFGKLNGLMFFHIPTPEWLSMYTDAENNRMRGARVIELDQDNLETFSTKMVYASACRERIYAFCPGSLVIGCLMTVFNFSGAVFRGSPR